MTQPKEASSWWTLKRDDQQRDVWRLAPVAKRELGSAQFTWAHLLYRELYHLKVLVLYLPSRTDREEDRTSTKVLRSFGKNTGPTTSVNVWDPTDPEFTRALELFDIRQPPALVLASGLQLEGVEAEEPQTTPLYQITVSDVDVLRDPDRLSTAVNSAHEVLMRCDPKEISRYIRARQASSILKKVSTLGGNLRDELLKLKPTFGLPGGFSIKLG